MGNLKLFTVSLALIFLSACGSGDSEEVEDGGKIPSKETPQEDLVVDPAVDSTEVKLLYGSWQLIQINEQSIEADNPLFGLKQTFMPDRTWFISSPKPEEDSIVLVEGGRWSFDINSRQLSILFTADSIYKTIMLEEINQQKMMIQTLEGVHQAWSKIPSEK